MAACGHPCSGLCGEACPTVCKVCNGSDEEPVLFIPFAEVERVVQLSCGHAFAVETLDSLVNGNLPPGYVGSVAGGGGGGGGGAAGGAGAAASAAAGGAGATLSGAADVMAEVMGGGGGGAAGGGGGGAAGSVPGGPDGAGAARSRAVALPACPLCRAAIGGVYRYANVMRAWQTYTDRVKMRMVYATVRAALLAKFATGVAPATEYARSQAPLLGADSLPGMLCELVALAGRSRFVVSFLSVPDEVASVSAIMERLRVQLGAAPEDGRVYNEVIGVGFAVLAKLLQWGGSATFRGGRYDARVCAVYASNLLAGSPMAVLPDVLAEDGRLRDRAIAAMAADGGGVGHWFTCPRGHLYVIGECGGAMHEARCPDCGSTVGGGSHTLRADNHLAVGVAGTVAAAWPTMMHR